MRFLSICSGIEAATIAWEPLGWTAAAYSEIDPFPSAVLAARFGSNLPGELWSRNAPPNIGDFTAADYSRIPGLIDVLVGGTPCQSFSLAGRRLSLADARGNLALAYVVLAHELVRSHGLRSAVWENVPGVLSTDDNAFGCFLAGLVGADDPVLPSPKPRGRAGNDHWKWSDEINGLRPAWPDLGMVAGPRARAAWRILDAQWFGLAQRRERVFVVVDFGNGADPAKVLFEPKSLRGNSPPRREAGERAAATVTASAGGCSGKDGIDGRLAYGGGGNRSGPVDVAATLTAKGQHIDFEVETFIASSSGDGYWREGVGPLRARKQDSHESLVVAHAPDLAATLTRGAESAGRGGYAGRRQEDDSNLVAAYDLRGREGGAQFEGPHDTANLRAASGGSSRSYVQSGWAVRRLTPVECARLQGFPDGHSRIAWRGRPAEQCPDGPQYKAFGNSMATTVMRWIGARLHANMPKRRD